MSSSRDYGRPLLPAKRRPVRQHPPAAKGRHRAPTALAAAAVLVAVAIALLHRWATQPQPDVQMPEHADSTHELHLLHEHPSARFCALPPPLICAHGGDPNVAPPNTLEAFQAALDGGATCVEVDVARTRDGRLVVLHSRELAHLLQLAAASAGTGAAGSPAAAAAAVAAAAAPSQVGDYAWEQLAALRWEGGERVAAAEEVLSLVVPRTEHVTLDVKPQSDAEASS